MADLINIFGSVLMLFDNDGFSGADSCTKSRRKTGYSVVLRRRPASKQANEHLDP